MHRVGLCTGNPKVLALDLFLIWSLVAGFCCGFVALERDLVRRALRTKDGIPKVDIWGVNKITNQDIIYHRVGQSLTLNCSIHNHSASEIAWKRGQEWLDSRSHAVVLEDYQILTLDFGKLSWQDNNTSLWCGPREDNATFEGRNITVVVGNLPEAPVAVSWRIVGTNEEIQVHWKPSPNTGSLLTKYKITFTNCFNTTYCKGLKNVFTQAHIPWRTHYKFKILLIDLNTSSGWPATYNVTVAAINTVGESSGNHSFVMDFYNFAQYIYPTPNPPLSFSARARGRDSIQAQWVPRVDWSTGRMKMNYTVIYTPTNLSRDAVTQMVQHGNIKSRLFDSKHMEIKILNVNTTAVTLQNLASYTVYFIYLTANFIKDSPNDPGGGNSEVLGPLSVRTVQGIPESGPEVVHDSSQQWPDEPGKRNVTIWWKVPPQTAWKGIPASFHVKWKSESTNMSLVIVPVSEVIPNMTVLPSLSTEETYSVYMNMCNQMDCGGIGEQWTVHKFDAQPSSPTPDSAVPGINQVLLIALTVAGIILVLSGAAAMYIRKRNSRQLIPLDKRVSDVDPEDRYDEPEVVQNNENYDDAYILTITNPAIPPIETQL